VNHSSRASATRFEFAHRFWIIGAIFGVGFDFAFIDHVNAAVAFLHVIRPSVSPDAADGRVWLRLLFAAGAALAFAAAALRTWATAYLRADVVHDLQLHAETHVADGAFRYVRNPLYLANLLLVVGVGLMASRTGWLFMVVAMAVFVHRLIRREEAELLAEHGESFAAYMRAVPRLWPALHPRIPSGRVQPRWGQAVLGELFVWLMGVSVLCFAATLRFRLTGLVLMSSVLIYFVLESVRKRSQRRLGPVQ
jgi:protein-S-isoprenylcysteine O-methyltransferase Ste14